MEFMVLGPLEVLDGDRGVRLGSAKQRLLLGALLVHANQVVSVDRLADILWGDDQPSDATAALQTYVSRLRSTLRPKGSADADESPLLTRAPGYLLRVEPEQLDAARFAAAVADGQRAAADGDPKAAVTLLEEALMLWRGDAYAEFADHDFCRTDALQLEELRRVAVEERVEARLALGLHAELVGELEGIVSAEPLRERPRAQLMLALYRSGRDAEALRAFQDYRRYLGEELGVQPSAALAALERDIVDQKLELRAAATIEDMPAPDSAPAPARPTRAPTPDAMAPTEPRPDLYGRADELDALRGWLSDAVSGSPRIVVLVGGPGIGKSQLTAALLYDARAAGVRPLVGRAIEGSELPLLPVANMLDTLGVGESALRAGEPAVVAHGPSNRLRTVVEVSRALLATAAEEPALVVLEDVQWADAVTIELLMHIAATFAHEAVYQQLPLALVVTARPGAGSPEARRLLARLGNETGSHMLTLRGLDEIGTFSLIGASTGRKPSTRLVRRVHAVTDGNPGAIKALLEHLESAGALDEQDGELIVTRDELIEAPDDAQTLTVSRLDALSASTRAALTTVAALRDPTLDHIRLASELAPDDLDGVLDEAIDAGVLIDDGVRVTFTDGAIRRALLEQGGVRRRQRRHATIAGHLAAGAPDPSAADHIEIVEQLLSAGRAADDSLLRTHARAAGDASLRAGTWIDATRYYEVALDAAGEDAERGDLERAAATAAYRANDSRAASAHADAAIALARDAGDLDGWGEAALLRARAALATRGIRGQRDAIKSIEDFLEAADDDVPAHRARGHAILAEIASTQLRHDIAEQHAEAANAIAEHLDDPALDAGIEFMLGLQRFGVLELEVATRHFRRCEERARAAGDTLIEAWALGRRPLVLWCAGKLDAADEAATVALRHDREHGWWGEYAFVAALRAGIAVASGNLAALERLEGDAASAIDHCEMTGAATLLWPAVAGARALRGDSLGAHHALDEWEREDVRGVARSRDLVNAFTPEPGATPPPEPVPLTSFIRSGAPLDVTGIALAANDVELADALERPELAEDAIPFLLEGYERGVRFVAGWCLFVPRLAGIGHLLTGDPTGAVRWLEQAVDDARAAGAAGEVARASYDLARARLARGDSRGTTELLRDAISELDRLGYDGLRGSARRLAGLPVDGEAVGSGTRVILVTDLIDSTPLNQRLGDEKFVELLRDHNRIVRAQLHAFDGVEFKHTGDGIAAWFFNADTAVRCALAIRDEVDRFNVGRDDAVQVRIGLAAGEVIPNEGDLFGLTVVEAFRICDHARDGVVLVSDEVARRAGDDGLTFERLGEVALKGFASPRTVHAVTASA